VTRALSVVADGVEVIGDAYSPSKRFDLRSNEVFVQCFCTIKLF